MFDNSIILRNIVDVKEFIEKNFNGIVISRCILVDQLISTLETYNMQLHFNEISLYSFLCTFLLVFVSCIVVDV